jgi:predicted MFS family arabinose efflux permease
VFAPLRLLYGARPRAPLGILMADAVAVGMFVATPFLVPEVAGRFQVPLGAAGLISTAQVGGFALTALAAGRWVRASGRVLAWGTGLLVVTNAASAMVGEFPSLLALRALAGAGAGLLSWLAWSEAMTHERGLNDVAAVGPLAAMLGSPLFGWLAGMGGDRAVFLALAISSLPLLWVTVTVEGVLPDVSPRRRSRSNRVLLGALFLLTLSGSSLFVYAAAAAQELGGIDPITASGAFSLNAAAGIVATRLGPRRLPAGVWLATGAPCAMAIVFLPNVLAFYLAVTWWGFAFWMGLPKVFRLLADRSRAVNEQVGAAQGVMAIGRALGPMLGGALLGDGRYQVLGVGAAIGLLAASGLTGVVESYRGLARAK